jgi:hypothetical protein
VKTLGIFLSAFLVDLLMLPLSFPPFITLPPPLIVLPFFAMVSCCHVKRARVTVSTPM